MTTPFLSFDKPVNGNATGQYSLSYRMLHWTMGGGFIVLLIAGQQFNFDLSTSYKTQGLIYHSTIGSVVLIACLTLLLKRLVRRDARPNNGLVGFKHLMANMAQGSLYALALLVPLSGLATAYYAELPTQLFGLWNISQMTTDPTMFLRLRFVHELSTFMAIALVALHVTAALYHHFVKQDQVLSSMTITLPENRFKRDVNARNKR